MILCHFVFFFFILFLCLLGDLSVCVVSFVFVVLLFVFDFLVGGACFVLDSVFTFVALTVFPFFFFSSLPSFFSTSLAALFCPCPSTIIKMKKAMRLRSASARLEL